MKLFNIIITMVVAFFLIAGCVVQKKLDDAQRRINALEEKGAPDSVIAGAKVALFQATSAKKIGDTKFVRKFTDETMICLEKAETDFNAAIEKMRPYVESTRKTIKKRMKQLSGLQLKTAQGFDAAIDSMVNKGWILQAKQKCEFLDTLMNSLLKDEEKAKEAKSSIVGTWVSTRVPDAGYKAVEKRKFTFGADAKFSGEEEIKGQTSAETKEEWKFLSWGSYQIKGDTVLMNVQREKCARQNYWNHKIKNGKLQWVLYEAPTYDSTITNGKKDRWLTFEHIKETFDKK